jgi:hypothetical protein
MAFEHTKLLYSKALQNLPALGYFWFENLPSGKPACQWDGGWPKSLPSSSEKSAKFNQGCQMVCFQTKPPFWEPLELKKFGIFYDHLVCTLCGHLLFISWQFGICYGNSLKYPHFGILCQEKSGPNIPKRKK